MNHAKLPRTIIKSGVRYRTSTTKFDHLKAIDPRDLSRPRPSRLQSKWLRRGLIISGLGVLGYTYDQYFNSRAISRASRAVYVLFRVAADYKLNYGPQGAPGHIEALHKRNANLIYDLLVGNKGLYIKIGQSIGMQAAILPRVYQEKFGQLFDGAPADDYDSVEALFQSEFNGKRPEDIFINFDKTPMASASIAQVHKAQLKSGEYVAVKVQHPDIANQMEWDLNVYKGLMYIYEHYLFHMPMYFTADYVAGRLRKEIDFLNELKNGENLRKCLERDSSLRDKVYIPKNYAKLSTSRILVSEWIDGVALSNTAELRNPENGINLTQTLKTIMQLFANQIFQYGVVHCDPHPGNMIVRRHPVHKGGHQVVLIDHGLYIYEKDTFRKEYCQLWESLFIMDSATLARVVTNWGFGEPEMFASMTLLKPYKTKSQPIHNNNNKNNDEFDRAQELRERLKNFLHDTTVVPLELMFLARTIRILQGLNQRFGSRVNRVKIMAKTAARSLVVTSHDSYPQQTRLLWRYLRFRFGILLSDIGFYALRFYQRWLGKRDSAGEGMEDVLGKQIQEMSTKYGLEVDASQIYEG